MSGADEVKATTIKGADLREVEPFSKGNKLPLIRIGIIRWTRHTFHQVICVFGL